MVLPDMLESLEINESETSRFESDVLTPAPGGVATPLPPSF